MYNLIMSGLEETWNGQPFELSRDRIFEYTDDEIAASFRALEVDQIAKLIDFPTLFCYEAPCKKDFHFGFIENLKVQKDCVTISYRFDDQYPPLDYDLLQTVGNPFDLWKLEQFRTHWAIKDVDLYRVLEDLGLAPEAHQVPTPNALEVLRNLPPSPTYEIQPIVFRLPSRNNFERIVSVMLPFDPAFKNVLETIKSSAVSLGFICLTAQDVWDNSEIIQDVFDLIFRSKIVICDFSQKNANVFYEAGIAHTLGRHVIPIAQSIEDVPFDLRHHRVHIYSPKFEGLAELSEVIKLRIRKLDSL